MKNIIFIFLLTCAIPMSAQRYESRLLQEMSSALNLSSLVDSNFVDNTIQYTYKKHPIKVQANNQGIISHIGCKLFPDSMDFEYNEILLRFLERITLEAMLPNAKDVSWKQQLEDHGLYFVVGSFQNFLKMNCNDLTISVGIKERENMFAFSISYSKKLTCQLLISKDYQLITGKDKTELDNQLFKSSINLTKTNIPAIYTTFVKDIPIAE